MDYLTSYSLPSRPFIEARVVLDPAKGPYLPYRCSPCPMNPIQHSGLEDKIALWLKQGAIKEASSQWNFPILSVLKKRRPEKDKPTYRFCADLRVLNSRVLRDSCFLGSVPANLALLQKHEIYSSMTLFNAFESGAVAPDSRDFFAFFSPSGRQ